MNGKVECRTCLVCKKSFSVKNLIPMATVRKVITEQITHDYPECSSDDFICQRDLTQYRMQYVQSILHTEQGEVSNLEYEVLNSMKQHELISKNIEG